MGEVCSLQVDRDNFHGDFNGINDICHFGTLEFIRMIKYFGVNEDGRDFVVGDIHGSFHKLEKRLYELKFNKKWDRLFSVGDLVDRGIDSERCASFLQKSWFHAIRGNHEEMAIEYFNERWPEDNYVVNGGQWFVDMSKEWQTLFVKEFQKLPYLMEIETKNSGKVGIVHAECRTPDWDLLKIGLNSDHAEIFKEMCLWSRERIKNNFEKEVKGIDKIFVGHTPVSAPLILGNHHYIDTGAVFGNELTIMEI